MLCQLTKQSQVSGTSRFVFRNQESHGKAKTPCCTKAGRLSASCKNLKRDLHVIIKATALLKLAVTQKYLRLRQQPAHQSHQYSQWIKTPWKHQRHFTIYTNTVTKARVIKFFGSCMWLYKWFTSLSSHFATLCIKRSQKHTRETYSESK